MAAFRGQQESTYITPGARPSSDNEPQAWSPLRKERQKPDFRFSRWQLPIRNAARDIVWISAAVWLSFQV